MEKINLIIITYFCLCILLFPLVGSISAGFFGKFLGRNGTVIVSSSLIGLNLLLSIIFLYFIVCTSQPIYINLFSWVESGLFKLQWEFCFDAITAIMLFIVNAISCAVHLYSYTYMKNDPHIQRFFSYLSLFTFFMLLLVTAENYIQLFLGWEGVGLCSYLLISFWFTRLEANKAALKAIIVNRIGDLGLILGIVLIYTVFKTLNFSVIFTLTPYFTEFTLIFFNFKVHAISLICFFLFIGVMGKSAQLGLHTWLPDAMEGPTPVSALIHAATMVTAGVFLLIRCSILFEHAPSILVFITFIGGLTAFFAATVGLVQNDIKKVVAYSTCSQLGYMIFICGLSGYSLSFFHLFTHAFFKALLFLGSGAVIHSINDEQDMRRMGGFFKILPFTYIVLLIGSLSLIGFPFLSGFYSKDLILEFAFAKYTFSSFFVYWLGTISAFFTAFYSFRLLYLVFFNQTNAFKYRLTTIHDVSFLLIIVLGTLSLGSIFFGFLFKDLFIGLGSSFFNFSIYTKAEHLCHIELEFTSTLIKNIPVIFSIGGGILSYLVLSYTHLSTYLFLLKTNKYIRNIYTFLNKKWYFDLLYNNFINLKILKFCFNITFRLIDKGLLEIFGPSGILTIFKQVSNDISELHSGSLYRAICVIVLTIIYVFLLITLF